MCVCVGICDAPGCRHAMSLGVSRSNNVRISSQKELYMEPDNQRRSYLHGRSCSVVTLKYTGAVAE